jgi:hypothetical protein
MNEQHHVTFIRDADRTRIIFALPGHLTPGQAREHAETLKPLPGGYGPFRFAAQTTHAGGPICIPGDGDDYTG